MLSPRQLKNRIRSIESTRKIARAMELVSNTKLRRVAIRGAALRPYSDRLEEIFRNLLTAQEAVSHPLLEEREKKKSVALCVVTSDSGLCGPYNANILQAAQKFLTTISKKEIRIIPVGKRGFTYFRRHGYTVPRSFLGLNGRYQESVFKEISGYLQDLFLRGEADEVYVAYTRFENNVRHHPMVEKFLNIPSPRPKAPRGDFILEPNFSRILETIIPEYIDLKVCSFILHSFACEHSARIIAMSMAKENAIELLDQLNLLQNKMRQASITKEVAEIITAAEALRG